MQPTLESTTCQWPVQGVLCPRWCSRVQSSGPVDRSAPGAPCNPSRVLMCRILRLAGLSKTLVESAKHWVRAAHATAKPRSARRPGTWSAPSLLQNPTEATLGSPGLNHQCFRSTCEPALVSNRLDPQWAQRRFTNSIAFAISNCNRNLLHRSNLGFLALQFGARGVARVVRWCTGRNLAERVV